jgi:hypothetical protein
VGSGHYLRYYADASQEKLLAAVDLREVAVFAIDAKTGRESPALDLLGTGALLPPGFAAAAAPAAAAVGERRRASSDEGGGGGGGGATAASDGCCSFVLKEAGPSESMQLRARSEQERTHWLEGLRTLARQDQQARRQQQQQQQQQQPGGGGGGGGAAAGGSEESTALAPLAEAEEDEAETKAISALAEQAVKEEAEAEAEADENEDEDEDEAKGAAEGESVVGKIGDGAWATVSGNIPASDDATAADAAAETAPESSPPPPPPPPPPPTAAASPALEHPTRAAMPARRRPSVGARRSSSITSVGGDAGTVWQVRITGTSTVREAATDKRPAAMLQLLVAGFLTDGALAKIGGEAGDGVQLTMGPARAGKGGWVGSQVLLCNFPAVETPLESNPVAWAVVERMQKLLSAAVDGTCLVVHVTARCGAADAPPSWALRRREMARRMREGCEQAAVMVVQTGIRLRLSKRMLGIAHKAEAPGVPCGDPKDEAAAAGVADAAGGGRGFTFLSYGDGLPNLDAHRSAIARALRRDRREYARLFGAKTAGGITFWNVVQPGIESAALGGLGMALGDAECADTFAPLLRPLLCAHHQLAALPAAFASNYSPAALTGGPLQAEVLQPYSVPGSIRLTVRRNLHGLPFPPGATADSRAQTERALVGVLESLTGESLGGTYFPLAEIDPPTRAAWRKSGLLFADAPPDSLLALSGAARGWPRNRGVFLTDDHAVSVWVNELDHLRINIAAPRQGAGAAAEAAVGQAPDISLVFARLGTFMQGLNAAMGALQMRFAAAEALGYVTVDPAFCGSAMSASLALRLPMLGQAMPNAVPTLCQHDGVCAEHAAAEEEGGAGDDSQVWLLCARRCLADGMTEANSCNALITAAMKAVVLEAKLASGGISEAQVEPIVRGGFDISASVDTHARLERSASHKETLRRNSSAKALVAQQVATEQLSAPLQQQMQQRREKEKRGSKLTASGKLYAKAEKEAAKAEDKEKAKKNKERAVAQAQRSKLCETLRRKLSGAAGLSDADLDALITFVENSVDSDKPVSETPTAAALPGSCKPCHAHPLIAAALLSSIVRPPPAYPCCPRRQGLAPYRDQIQPFLAHREEEGRTLAKVQAMARGTLFRLKVMRNGMIVSVQASWRGHAARGVFKAVKSAMSSGVSWRLPRQCCRLSNARTHPRNLNAHSPPALSHTRRIGWPGSRSLRP